MKKILLIFSIICAFISCKEGSNVAEEEPFPTATYNGEKYLDLKKSPHYPSLDGRTFEEYVKADGRITIDSTEGFFVIHAKMWIADSMFENMARKANLNYSKTFLIDTTSKESIFDFSNGIEVKNIKNDTAYYQLKVRSMNISPEQLKEKWTMKIVGHFEDSRGISTDTSFLSNFNADWMQ
ncbi:hypothetical protein [uncultured Pontibacter sp.]|uniref:hypothetical protein n=1 Tax=uncultured Pontibacter sp. TaxID=453356 RepID=UPI00262AEE8B|nr:hypothetical protein [uncultured Pontibacter sp.]